MKFYFLHLVTLELVKYEITMTVTDVGENGHRKGRKVAELQITEQLIVLNIASCTIAAG